MKNRLFYSTTALALSLFCAGSLTSCDKNNQSIINSLSALVEISTNGHGTISVSALSEGNLATLNTSYTVTATPDNGYRLDSVSVNGTDITAALSFTPTDASVHYIVNAVFVVDVDQGETKVVLKGKTGVEVGNTMQLDTEVFGPNSMVTYKSSDTSLATVDQNGLVTAVKPGFVTVTASSVLSTETKDISDNCTFFVMPSYISKMVDGMSAKDYDAGLSMCGELKIGFTALVSSVVNPDKKMETIPYTFDFKLNPDASSYADIFNFSLDLDISKFTLGGMLTFMGPMLLGRTASLTNLVLDYVGDGMIGTSLYGILKGNDVKEILTYSQLDVFSLVGKLLGSVLNLDKDTFNLTVPSIASTLNSILTFDTDINKGISINKSTLDKADKWLAEDSKKFITDFVNDSDSIPDDFKPITAAFIPSFLPENLQEVSFKVTLDEEDNFKDATLKVIDQASDVKDDTEGAEEGSKVSVNNTYLSLNLSSATTALKNGYFDEKEDENATLKTESRAVSDFNTDLASFNSVYCTSNKLYTAKVYDYYHFDKSFKSKLSSLVTEKKTLLGNKKDEDGKEIENDPYITNKSLIKLENAAHIKNYLTFAIQDTNANKLTNYHTVSLGDVYKVNSIAKVGTKVTQFQFSDKNNIKDADGNVIGHYLSYNAENNTITVDSLPTEKKLAIAFVNIVDEEDSEAYGNIQYTFNLPVSAAVE